MSQGIVIDFNANTAKFNQSINRSNKDLASFQTKAVEAGKQIGKAMGLMFVAGAAASVAFAKRSIDSADAMSKLSQSTGVAIERLSGLAYAGRLSDVSVEALGSAMVKLTKGMSDAAQNTGEAIKGYQALGISVKDSAGNLKNSDVVMSEVADKFASMEDGANKTALAVAIFGKSGAAMIPMLNSGSKGIKEMTDEADKLGLVIGDKAGKASERFNDNLTRLGAVGEGFSNKVTAAMLPVLEKMSRSLFETAASAGGLDKAVLVAETAIKSMMTAGAGMVGVFKTLGESLGGFAATAAAVFSGNFAEAFRIAESTVTDFGKNIDDSIGSINAIWKAEGDKVVAESEDTGTKLAAPMMVMAEKTEKSTKKMAKVTEKATDEMSVFAKRAAENMQDALAEFLFDPFDGGIKGMVEGFANAMRRMAAEAAAANIMGAATSFNWGALFGGVTGSGANQSPAPSITSFAGGGSTGNAPRSGGMDGQGGFMAMLHPQEHVFDKAGGGTGGSNIVINTSPTYNIEAGADRAQTILLINNATKQANAELVDTLTRQGVL